MCLGTFSKHWFSVGPSECDPNGKMHHGYASCNYSYSAIVELKEEIIINNSGFSKKKNYHWLPLVVFSPLICIIYVYMFFMMFLNHKSIVAFNSFIGRNIKR